MSHDDEVSVLTLGDSYAPLHRVTEFAQGAVAYAGLLHHLPCPPHEAILQSLPAHVRLLAVLHDGPGVVDEARALRRTLGDRCAILLDPPDRGGRGIPIDRARAYEIARGGPLVLAGGLAPDNVGEAIRRVRPWAVDVSSGVEWLPGVKNRLRIAAFVVAVRFAEAEINRLDGTE